MAKRTKVKPKTPVQKEPEWDYELAKQLIRGKKDRLFVFPAEESHIPI